jgi:hypothetical protein
VCAYIYVCVSKGVSLLIADSSLAGNLLHYDKGSKYSRKLPRTGDKVGLFVDMDMGSLEVSVCM